MPYLVLLALAAALLLLRWFLTTDAAVLAVAVKRGLMLLLVVGMIFLIFTGKLNFIVPLMMAIIPILGPSLRPYVQQPSSVKMTIDEAYKLLDLKPGASKEDIIAAHKRLMKKVHPDIGGSNYLAQKLNEAKDLLLRN